jgi:hypothetical protein
MHLSQPPIRMSVIARPKVSGGGEHWGVLFPGNLVAHNTPERGEHVSTLHEFAPGGKLRIVRYVPPEYFHASMRRIQEAVQCPGGYHATNNNCQSFANRITGEAPRSPAVEGVGWLALAGLLMYALASD